MSHDEKYYEEGIIRSKNNLGEYDYHYVNNKKKVTATDLKRINALRIPPAWEDVWVNRDPSAAIQAIGKDIKGRKQYKYNQIHINTATEEKFLRMIEFIDALPSFVKILNQHSKLLFYEKNKIISLMLDIVALYHMRVGKEVYARQNKSYGVSSLRKKHAKIENNILYFRFKGKSNQRLQYTIKDKHIVNDIKVLLKLEGDKLFQYLALDHRGNEKIYSVNDKDLNKYIQQYMGSQFTIKDFRTYGANETFISALLRETKKHLPKTKKQTKNNIIGAMKSTARQLKHTKAISKKSYVLNFAVELYMTNPELYIENKNMMPLDFLKMLLIMYKKEVLNK